MDIVIKYILEYMDSEKEDFIKEWETGQYTKISDCPTYPYIKAYCDAITVLNRMDGNYSGITSTSFVSHI